MREQHADLVAVEASRAERRRAEGGRTDVLT